MRAVKRFFSQLHRYLFWLLLMAFFWAWIFFMLTDTVKAKKVTVYIDAPEVRSAELEAALSGSLPEGIKLIKVHSFSYAAFNTLAANSADIYVMSADVLMENIENLAPISSAAGECADGGYYFEGELYGLPVRQAAGACAAASYIGYSGDGEYYICFNKDSVHITNGTGRGDGAAYAVAERMLALP